MARGKPSRRYSPAYRARLIALVRAGRTPEDLAREFEPAAQTIRNWVAAEDRAGGLHAKGPDRLTVRARRMRRELHELRREGKVLREEVEILRKAAAWFGDGTDAGSSGS